MERAKWLKEIEEEIINPLRERALNHPFIREVSEGRLPVYKVRRLLGDVLWSITGFPELIAALASRCPKYDHEVKTKLLANAYEERTHPQLLARVVRALGGDPEPMLNGPAYKYRPLKPLWHRRNWEELCVYHKPWVVAIAALGVGVESMVPYIFGTIGKGLKRHYGLKGEDMAWFRIHGGEVEMEHGEDGFRILERYVRPDDEETIAACKDAIEMTASEMVESLDTYYQYEGD